MPKITSIKDLPSQFGGLILNKVLKDIGMSNDEQGNVVILLKSENGDILAFETGSKEVKTQLIMNQNLNN